jgi:hypothetical protein
VINQQENVMVLDRSQYFKAQAEVALLEKVRAAGEKLQRAKPYLDKAAEHIAAYAAHHGVEVRSTDFEQHRRELINKLLFCGYI